MIAVAAWEDRGEKRWRSRKATMRILTAQFFEQMSPSGCSWRQENHQMSRSPGPSPNGTLPAIIIFSVLMRCKPSSLHMRMSFMPSMVMLIYSTVRKCVFCMIDLHHHAGGFHYMEHRVSQQCCLLQLVQVQCREVLLVPQHGAHLLDKHVQNVHHEVASC